MFFVSYLPMLSTAASVLCFLKRISLGPPAIQSDCQQSWQPEKGRRVYWKSCTAGRTAALTSGNISDFYKLAPELSVMPCSCDIFIRHSTYLYSYLLCKNVIILFYKCRNAVTHHMEISILLSMRRRYPVESLQRFFQKRRPTTKYTSLQVKQIAWAGCWIKQDKKWHIA